jgi:Protein of unknown function (DUF3313)
VKRFRLQIRAGLLEALMFCLAVGLSACSTTQRPGPNLIERIQGKQPAALLPSGFLGNYSQFQSGGEDQARLVYVNPTVQWSQYNKIMLAPVTFWASSDSKISAEDQHELCNYAYNAFKATLQKQFTVVDQSGFGIMRLQVSLTNADSATPVLRSISMLVLQARLLSTIKYLGTGTYAFVGGASGEGQITDSITGQRLTAWVDERVGGGNIKNVAVWKWRDAEHVFDNWSEQLASQLEQLRSRSSQNVAS